jgi:4-cresol dehydrogenase (hydroxylating)
VSETCSPGALAAAMAEWRAAIGPEFASDDAAALAQAGRTTFATTQRVLAWLRPADAAQVADCLRIAARHCVPLSPASQGKNWGLGGRVPVAAQAALLDLSRLRAIVGCDPTLGTLTVQPGVTYAEAHAYLARHAPQFWLSPIGGSPDSSVLANALERGEGPGPLGDHAGHAAGLQVVLPGGDLLETGFARFEGARTAGLSRYGVGPALDGLFAQSNLGVVTRMTLWLAQRPAHATRFRGRLPSLQALPAAIDLLRGLHQQRVLADCGYTLWNLYKLAALEGPRPTGLPPPAGQPFFLAGWIHAASSAIGQALGAEVQQQLAPGCDHFELQVVDAAVRASDPSADYAFPSPLNLRTTYWGKAAIPAVAEPEQDRCGVLWLCPALPFDGAFVAGLVERLTALGLAHGLEPHIGFSGISPRLLHLYVSLVYDRDAPGADAQAMACHDAMLALVLAEGCPPYRLGIQSMQWLQQRDGVHERLVRGLRAQLDPAHILAPGRYGN